MDDEPTINAVDGLMALSKPTASETRKLVRRVMTGRRATLKEVSWWSELIQLILTMSTGKEEEPRGDEERDEYDEHA